MKTAASTTEHRTSKYRGVTWEAKRKLWRARVRDPDGVTRHLGSFMQERDAAMAHDRAELYLYGDEAALNFSRKKVEPASLDEVRAWSRQLSVREPNEDGPFRGVYIDRLRPWRYIARLRLPSKQILALGTWPNPKQAAMARDRVVLGLGLPERYMNLPAQAKKQGPLSIEEARALSRETSDAPPTAADIERAREHMRPGMARFEPIGPKPRASRYLDVSLHAWAAYVEPRNPYLKWQRTCWGYEGKAPVPPKEVAAKAKVTAKEVLDALHLTGAFMLHTGFDLGPLDKLLTRLRKEAPIALDTLHSKAWWKSQFKYQTSVETILAVCASLHIRPGLRIRNVRGVPTLQKG